MSDDAQPFSFNFGASAAGGAESKSMGADQSNVPPASPSPETAEASAHLAQVRKRGRSPKHDPERIAREAALREDLLREMHQLFDPEQWGAICRGPADLMLHLSGRDLWRVEDRELKPLAVGAAHTARLFLQTDPKWIALFMFSVSLTQIYGARIALHLAQNRKEAAEKTGKDTTGKPV